MSDLITDVASSIPFTRDAPTPSPRAAGDTSRAVLEAHRALDPGARLLRSRFKRQQRIGVVSQKTQRLETDQAILEAIVGASNLLPAWFLQRGVEASRAVCLIETSGTNYAGQTKRWKGTGFLVSSNVLLTNHHVLNSVQVSQQAVCTFNYQITPSGGMLPVTSFRLRPSRLFLTSPVAGGLDYTFVWIDGQPGESFGIIPLDRGVLQIAARERANVISHPFGRPKTISIQDNRILWQDESVVHYTSDTQPGSSGACVCNNEWKLVALHHASRRTPATTHEFLNEGIKLSAIAAHVESLHSTQSHRPAREVLRLFRGTDQRMGFFGGLGRTGATRQNDLEKVVSCYRTVGHDVDIACWNLESLAIRSEDKLSEVAEAMFEMNLDLWVLQSVSLAQAEGLIRELSRDYSLEYDCATCDSVGTNGPPSVLIWNAHTLRVQRRSWGEPIETWFAVRGSDLVDVGGARNHGPIFRSVPAVFHLEVLNREDRQPIHLHLVPIRQSAESQGTWNDPLATSVLAAAMNRQIESGWDTDWVVCGRFPIAQWAGKCEDLLAKDRNVFTVAEENNGALSLIQGQRSLLGSVFLPSNLERLGLPAKGLIVADDRTLPSSLQDIGAEGPLLVRWSLGSVEAERHDETTDEKKRKKKVIKALAAVLSGAGRDR